MNLIDAEKGLETPGKRYLVKHIKGERITLRQAVMAKCFECMCGFADGRQDCKITVCALYPWMPFRQVKASSTAPKDPAKVERMRILQEKRRQARGGATQTPGIA